MVPLHLYILVLAVEMQNLEWKAYIFQNSSDKMDEVNKILFYLKRIAAPFLAVSTSMTPPTGASAVGRPVRLRVSSKEGVELWPRPRHRSDPPGFIWLRPERWPDSLPSVMVRHPWTLLNEALNSTTRPMMFLYLHCDPNATLATRFFVKSLIFYIWSS